MGAETPEAILIAAGFHIYTAPVGTPIPVDIDAALDGDFTDVGYTTDDGEEMSTRKIQLALKDLVSKENKTKPLSDDALRAALAKLGYPIARRTVAKYREQLGIPVARLRKN